MKMSKNQKERLNRDILCTGNRDSIEHIYPRNARHKYWTELFASYDSKQRRILRNTLGNLVAISEKKNGNLGNCILRSLTVRFAELNSHIPE